MEVIIRKSKKPDKKYDAVIDGKKTLSFGATGYSDFTQHKDVARKQRYLDWHKRNENWKDPKTAGFYATHVLWNKPSITASIADINKKFKNITVKLAR